MKLMLCVRSLSDILPVLEQLQAQPERDLALPFLLNCTLLHHQVTIVESGVGVYQTAYKVTKALSLQKYHLALKISTGNSYREQQPAGTVLNIVNDKPGDYGMMVDGEWRDYYDLNLMTREEKPQVRGGFINLTNAYMNIFLSYKKVVGVTVNHYADDASYENRAIRYKADCETGDGLGFVYPCLYEKQSFYHLCVIERNLPVGEANISLAAATLQATLLSLLQKL